MKKRILVVEDNLLNRELLCDWLEAEGHVALNARRTLHRYLDAPAAELLGHPRHRRDGPRHGDRDAAFSAVRLQRLRLKTHRFSIAYPGTGKMDRPPAGISLPRLTLPASAARIQQVLLSPF